MTRSPEFHMDPDFKEALLAAGLGAYESFMAHASEDYAARSRTTSTVRVHIPGSTGARIAYLKRYWYRRPVWKYSFRPSRAFVEQRNLNWMRKQGLPAPRVLAWGESRTALRLKSCFILTDAVPAAKNLDEFLPALAPPDAAELRRRRAAIQDLARHVAHMHSMSFVDHDLFFRNVLIYANGDGRYHFSFIDSPKGGPAAGNALRRGIAHDLASLNKTAREHLTATDCLRFLHSYFNKSKLDMRDLATMKEIERMSERMRVKSARKREIEAART